MALHVALVITVAVVVVSLPTAESFSMNPAHLYFDMIDRMHQQAQELNDFMANQPSSHNQHTPTIDAQIIEKKTSKEQGVKPPPLPQTNNPFTLLGLSVAASFDAIRRAYKEKVKVYHPDILVGPDASPEERKEANWDFARINAAYDILKRRENEVVYEYDMFVDGTRVSRTAYVDKEQRQYKRDANYIDYDRIRQMAEYRKTHPKKKMWYEEEHDYQPANNGFEKDASYCSNEKWYNHLEIFEYGHDICCPPYNGFVSTQETMRKNGFGRGYQQGQEDEEKFWHNRQTFARANNGNRWWDEDNSLYTRFDEEEGASFTAYNNRWYRKVDDNEFGKRNGYDNYESAQYDPTDTWYKQVNDDPKFNGNFGF